MKTTKIGYFDCFSGISGDMVLGALVDAGADLREIEAELRKLKLDGWSISAEKVKRRGISATQVKVDASTITDPAKFAEFQQAQDKLSGVLGRLMAISENYPDLKASSNFIELQRELTVTEDKIQAARRFYNTNVMDFNTKLEVFPTNMIASTLGFTREELFQLGSAEEAELPKVSF